MSIPRLKEAVEDILYHRTPKITKKDRDQEDYFREIAEQLVKKAVKGDLEAIEMIIKIEDG